MNEESSISKNVEIKAKEELTDEERHARRIAGLKPIQKGEIRNPTGRPKTPEEVKRIFAAATPDVARALVKLALDESKRASDRIKAGEIILDRSLGKAPTTVNIEARHSWDDLSDDELNKRLSRFGLLMQQPQIIDIDPDK